MRSAPDSVRSLDIRRPPEAPWWLVWSDRPTNPLQPGPHLPNAKKSPPEYWQPIRREWLPRLRPAGPDTQPHIFVRLERSEPESCVSWTWTPQPLYHSGDRACP